MAASARALTPTHSGPFSATSAVPNTPTSLSAAGPVSTTLNPQAAATSALRASLSPRSPRLSPQPPAGAIADKSVILKAREASRAMSPNNNPAIQAKEALAAGVEAAASRPRDAPPAATAQMTNPSEKVAKSIVIPENVTTDNIQTSPVSLSSFDSVEHNAPAATAIEQAASGPLVMESSTGQDRSTPQPQVNPTPSAIEGPSNSNRAFTFPGPAPLESDPRAPQRGMSLPMTGYAQSSPKSPNTKRHKCPYCSTDFTRHHNLKSHLLTHSQEKPYECPDCHARFRRLHDLKRHTKLHTGERPHICPKCGRRFARGDALARHNKGQGGCAGRRSSFAGDDEMPDARGDDAMDGLEYHGEGDESRMDDESMQDGARRVSDPSRRGQNSRQSSMQASYHQHGSTYPPVASASHAPGNSIRPLYPQGSSGTSSHDQWIAHGLDDGSSISSVPGQSTNVFAQGGMTESPKPISPGQSDQHHRMGTSDSGSLHGSRSPNMSQHVLPQQYARTTKGSSPMGLPPPPGNSNAPHLPSLPGLAPSDPRSAMARNSGKTGAPTAPSMLQHQVPGSNPGSLSSHGGSSGGSIRDIIGNREADVWSYVRDLEARTQRQNEQYEARIQQLEREVTALKSQLGQSPTQQAPQAPQPQVQQPQPQQQQSQQQQQPPPPPPPPAPQQPQPQQQAAR